MEEIRKTMKDKGTDVLVLSALDDIAWLLNLRGSDIQYNPVFFSYTVVTPDRVFLFVNEGQVCITALYIFLRRSVPCPTIFRDSRTDYHL